MKSVSALILSLCLISCVSNSDLKKENEELLELTRELTTQLEETKQMVIDATAEAKRAQAEALMQKELADKERMNSQELAAIARAAEANAIEQIQKIKEQYKDCK